MNVLAILEREFPPQAIGSNIEVGLSGGLDSVVLLHLLARLRETQTFALKAVHVHHGLSPFADEWADFCRDLCAAWDIPLRVVKVNVEAKGKGVEAAARAERYRVFSDGLSPIVALAHHQNDQIETFMLAAVRGGGLRGMAAMPPLRALNPQTTVWRPLLTLTREQLAQYATEHALSFVEDESNQDSGYLRNWLRHQALLQWQQRVPHFDRQILANIRSLQDDLALLDEITQTDYAQIVSDGLFHVEKWRSLSELRRRRVLHHLFQLHKLRLPSHKTIADMDAILCHSQAGKWQIDDAVIEYYRGALFVLSNPPHENHAWLRCEQKGRLKDILAENGFVLRPHAHGLSEEVLISVGIVRKVNNADVIKLTFGHKSTKKMLQESHILPSVRETWPIITNADNICLAVANLKVNQDFQTEGGFLPVYLPFERYITELNPTHIVRR